MSSSGKVALIDRIVSKSVKHCKIPDGLVSPKALSPSKKCSKAPYSSWIRCKGPRMLSHRVSTSRKGTFPGVPTSSADFLNLFSLLELHARKYKNQGWITKNIGLAMIQQQISIKVGVGKLLLCMAHPTYQINSTFMPCKCLENLTYGRSSCTHCEQAAPSCS